jgi:hypothetical protein
VLNLGSATPANSLFNDVLVNFDSSGLPRGEVPRYQRPQRERRYIHDALKPPKKPPRSPHARPGADSMAVILRTGE